jgi:hypothetical protein
MASTVFTNPPEFLGLQDYRSAVNKNGGPSKANRFVVRINALPQKIVRRGVYNSVVRDLSYLCEAAELPGRGFMNVDVRYYGPSFKMPFQTTYEDLNLTFLVRDLFLERQMFDDWLELINPSNTYNFNYKKDYICDIDIFQMSEIATSNTNEADRPGRVSAESRDPSPKVSAQYKFTFEEAWPILVNPMPVNWAEDNFNRLTVAFTYKRWHRERLDPNFFEAYDLVKGATNTIDVGSFLPTFLTTESETFGGPR